MMARVNSPLSILAAALALGWAVDMLFYGRALGISAPIFVLGLLATLFFLGRREDVRPAWRNLWLLAPLLFFAGMVALRANEFLTALNVLAVLALLGLLAYFYSAGRLERLGPLGYPITLILSVAHAIALAFPLVPASMEGRVVGKRDLPKLLPVMRGLLLALPVLLVFTGLLASADLVFAHYLLGIFNLRFVEGLQEAFGHVLIVLWVAWLLAGGFVYALSRRRSAADDEPWEKALGMVPRVIGFVESTTILVLVNLLFLAFGLIQFAYLFGGEGAIGAESLTYAEYARRGFFELVAVSALTLGLILGLHRLTRRDGAGQARIFNLLGTAMVGLTLVLLASAFWRMLMYEEAYGYTHLRLYVQVFELWLAVAFGWMLVTLWLLPNRFTIGAFVAALVSLLTINIANPDALIAQHNLARWEATGKLDVGYLTTLSDDAVPELLGSLDKLPGVEGDRVRRELVQRAGKAGRSNPWQDWPAFHFARWQAYDALMSAQAQLEKDMGEAGTGEESRNRSYP